MHLQDQVVGIAKHPAFWLAAAAVVLPLTLPLLMILAPLLILAGLVWLSISSRSTTDHTAKVSMQPLADGRPAEVRMDSGRRIAF